MEQNANIKPIQLQGIVRNETKIGVQDGQAEDLLNLRFTDGSWRASGDGRLINFTMGVTYTQLYVHTNVYHHLLGVAPDTNNSNTPTLWWFANIANDGVTFEALATPVKLTTVAEGDIWITQTGHLLTVIDAADDFEYFVYKEGDAKYIEVNLDVNGKQTDRRIFPFGRVNFNLVHPRPDLLFEERTIDLHTGVDSRYFSDADLEIKRHPHLSIRRASGNEDTDTRRNIITAAYSDLTENNKFTGAFFVCPAIRLYDGSYAYAGNPVLIFPRQQSLDKKKYFERNGDAYNVQNIEDAPNYSSYQEGYPINGYTAETDGITKQMWWRFNEDDLIDSFHAKCHPCLEQRTLASNNNLGIAEIFNLQDDILPPALYAYCQAGSSGLNEYIALLGYDLAISIENTDVLRNNRDVFQSLCIFITPEVPITDFNNKDNTTTVAMLSQRNMSDIAYELLYTPMFLLKEYKVEEIDILKEEIIIDLTKRDAEGLLKPDILVQRDILPIESTARTTYLPKTAYLYNNRLHIANYKSYPFLGYPIDLFHLNNHSVKVEGGKWFPNDTTQKVLPNITGNNDEYLQYVKEQITIKNTATLGDSENTDGTLAAAAAPYFLIKVYIDSSVGEQVVCRYIPAYDYSSPEEGRADFIEDLNPILTYPDARAKKMEIYFVDHYLSYGTLVYNPGYYVKRKEFTLKPHPYLNMAYYIDPDLKPIKLSEFGGWPVIQPIVH